MSDLISRQDAIDALIEWYGCEPNDMDYFKEILAKKSPAHLTQNNRVNSNNALDTISRQAAIDELMKRDKALRNINWYDKPFAEGECKGIDDALEIINALPSAQPEQKKGKWIGGELGYCTCCGHEGCASDMWSRCEKPHCPNCGAEMEGVQT